MRPIVQGFVLGLIALGAIPALAEPTETDTETDTDDALAAELAEAASRDAAVREQSQGADAAKAENIQQEDPLQSELGKEILGSESNPSLSFILDFTGAWFEEDRRVHLGGHAPTMTGPNLTGAELAASANVDPYFRFDLALCFAHMHLEEVTFTTLALPGNFQARGGLFLSRVGRVNDTHPHSWHFVLHPLANQFLFGSEGLGAPGLEISWLSPLPWYVEIIGAIQAGEGGAFRMTPLSAGEPDFTDFLYPLRLVQFFDLADDWALQLGGNAVFGPSAIGPEAGNRASAYGGDLLLKWRPIGVGETGYTYVALSAEVWLRELEVPLDLWRDVGGYADLVFGIDKRWELGARGELWRRLAGDAPSEENGRDRLGLDTVRGSGQLAFLPSHFSRIRLQYTHERLEGFENNNIVLLQLEVSAGAHGAHAY